MKPIADQQLKAMKRYLREKAIPVVVGSPDQMDEEHHKKFLTYLGFTKIENVTGQFLCKFPVGWKKVLPFGMKEFCYLLDKEKRRRAAIFYKTMGGVTPEEALELKIDYEKAKLYNKVSSHINYMPRYRTKIDHVIPMKLGKTFRKKLHYNSAMIGRVMDSETLVLFETKPVDMPIVWDEKQPDKYNAVEAKIRTDLFIGCETWLNRKYHEHKNIAAYWDVDDKLEEESESQYKNKGY